MKRTNKDFSGKTTPLFPPWFVQLHPHLISFHHQQTTTPPPHITTLASTPTIPTQSVQPSQPRKSKDKEKGDTRGYPTLRVKKLEKRKKKGAHKIKRLYKVGLSARVVSSDDEEPILDVQEDKFKQGRSIADIDDDADITLVNEGEGRNEEMFDAEKDLSGEEVIVEKVAEKSTPKSKGVTIMEPSDTQRTEIPRQKNLYKGKGKMDEIEKPVKLSRKEQISFDEEEARRLQALFDEESRMAEEAAKKEA
ncbi:hypothetical protein Tco_0286885 [Tanacetum coccineum]